MWATLVSRFRHAGIDPVGHQSRTRASLFRKGQWRSSQGIVISDLFYVRCPYRHTQLLKCLHCPVEKGNPVAEIEFPFKITTSELYSTGDTMIQDQYRSTLHYKFSNI